MTCKLILGILGSLLILAVQPARGQFSGLAGFAAPNGNATISAGTLTLTADAGSQNGSAYFATPQAVSNFTATFRYTPTFGGTPADGATFVIQNHSAGVTALGTGGNGLGVEGLNNAVSIQLNLLNAAPGGVGSRVGVNNTGSQYAQTRFYGAAGTGISLASSGTPTDVTVSYRDGVLSSTLTQGANTATRRYLVDLPAAIGGATGLVGFTGATGGQSAQQQVSNVGYTLNTAAAPSPRGWVVQQSLFDGTAQPFAINLGGGSDRTQIENITEGVALANGTNNYQAQHRTTTELVNRVNADSVAGTFPINGSNSDFAVKYRGTVKNVTGTSGVYNLFAHTSDGFRLAKNGSLVGEFAGQTAASDTLLSNVTLTDGDLLELYVFRRNGGGFAELRVNSGTGAFVGDDASGINILFAPVPEPTTMLALPAALGALAWARRRNSRR